MSESSWGLKRQCPKCSVWFYDFSKDPIMCPGCEGSFTATDFMKLKLSKSEYTAPIKKKEKIEDFTETVDLDNKELVIEDTEELSDNTDIKVNKPNVDDDDDDS